MKALQLHSAESLAKGQQMTADEIARFLEDFRLLHGNKPQPSKLISLKVPVPLLNAFRFQCEQQGLKYQTQIKVLMKDWLHFTETKPEK